MVNVRRRELLGPRRAHGEVPVCPRETTTVPRRHASWPPKHWSKIVSNCSRSRRSEQNTHRLPLATHDSGVEATELWTVRVDRASTEQTAGGSRAPRTPSSASPRRVGRGRTDQSVHRGSPSQGYESTVEVYQVPTGEWQEERFS